METTPAEAAHCSADKLFQNYSGVENSKTQAVNLKELGCVAFDYELERQKVLQIGLHFHRLGLKEHQEGE